MPPASPARRICTLGRTEQPIIIQCHTTSVIVTQGSQETGTLDARSVLRAHIDHLIISMYGVARVILERLPYQAQLVTTVAFSATSDTTKQLPGIVLCVRAESTRTPLAVQLQRARAALEQRALHQAAQV